jgi:hypothetical protein
MNNQTYTPESESFNQVLDAFEQAIKSGDERRIEEARNVVKLAAPLQAAEYDANVRHGLKHIFGRWVRGESSPQEFGAKFMRALNAGDYYPNLVASAADFEQAFPHLNFATTRMGGLQYASISTERLWRLHQNMVKFKQKEGVC